MSPERYRELRARCEAVTKNKMDVLLVNCQEMLDYLDEFERLQKAIEASKGCQGEMEECDRNIACEKCENWDYPRATRKVLEGE